MADKKRKYTIFGRALGHTNTPQPAKQLRLQNNDDTETHVKVEFQKLSSILKTHGIEYNPDEEIASKTGISPKQQAQIFRNVEDDGGDDDDCTITEIQPVNPRRSGIGIQGIEKDQSGTELDSAMVVHVKLDSGESVQVLVDSRNREARLSERVTQHHEIPTSKVSTPVLKLRAPRDNLIRASKSGKSVEKADFSVSGRDFRAPVSTLEIDIPNSNHDNITRQAHAGAKPMHYLSSYEFLPADAPWSHAHIIFNEDNTPHANLDLPDIDCVLPDILVSAIFKYSREALDAFLDIFTYPEFWFHCLMPARSVHYNWSISRRGGRVQVALLTDLKLPDSSLRDGDVADDSIAWTKIANKHNFPATLEYTFISAGKPWTCPDKLPVWSTAFTDIDLNPRRGMRKGDAVRDDLLDDRALHLYKYIRKHVFELEDYESLEADWGQKLRYHLPSGRVRGFAGQWNGNWILGHTADDLSSGTDDTAYSDTESIVSNQNGEAQVTAEDIGEWS